MTTSDRNWHALNQRRAGLIVTAFTDYWTVVCQICVFIGFSILCMSVFSLVQYKQLTSQFLSAD